MRCGRNLLKAFLEYYRSIGLIPIDPVAEISIKKGRPKTHRSRSSLKTYPRSRPSTTKPRAILHFKDLNINYDSDSSLEEGYSYRYSPRKYSKFTQHELELQERFVKKVGPDYLQKINEPRYSSPINYIVPPVPSLSIVNFNFVTRDPVDHRNKKNMNS